MKDLTAFQRDLLQVVRAGSGVNGLEVKEQLEEYYGKDVNHGQLYPNLDKLEEKGYVLKRSKDARSNEYHITEKAEEELEERKEWENKQAGELF